MEFLTIFWLTDSIEIQTNIEMLVCLGGKIQIGNQFHFDAS